jgi:cytochrome c
MKRIAMIAAGLALAVAGSVQASEELAKKSGCLTCHNVSGPKKMGPSFKDAAKDGEDKILAALNDPKKHGAVKASAEDKATLAKWIAGMK